jgi:hypothetical protein
MRARPTLGTKTGGKPDVSYELGVLEPVMLARVGEFDLPKRNLRSLFAMPKENVFVGHMIFRKQVLRTGHADRIRRKRCGCSALRSVPAINNLPA